MRYSVVIISKDRRQLLENCIKKLQDAHVPAEIIVVEATDAEVPLIAKDVKYIRLPHAEAGFSKQRNVAIEHATGDHIVFIDDDVEVTSEWFEKLTKPIEEDANMTGIMGAVFPLKPNLLGFCEGVMGHPSGGFKLHYRAQDKPLSLNGISTCNSVMKKSIICGAGGFQTGNTYGGEDTDLTARIITKYGPNRFQYNPYAIVYHHPRNSVAKIVPWYFRRGKSNADLLLCGRIRLMELVRSAFLLKFILVVILSIILRNEYILLGMAAAWYSLELIQYKYMWEYFKHYPFTPLRQIVTYLAFPAVKLIADVMFDLGRIVRLVTCHAENYHCVF